MSNCFSINLQVSNTKNNAYVRLLARDERILSVDLLNSYSYLFLFISLEGAGVFKVIIVLKPVSNYISAFFKLPMKRKLSLSYLKEVLK